MENFSNNEKLRKKALEQYKYKKEKYNNFNEKDLPEILEELSIHQIELEVQNEELKNTQSNLSSALENYSDLYDFAPVGYLTLDYNSIIKNINLTGASLFEIERSYLYDKPVGPRIHPQDREILFKVVKDVINAEKSDQIQIRVLNRESVSIWTQWIIRPEKKKSSEYYARVAVVNIDEQRKMEEEVKKKNRTLELTNKDLDMIQKKLNLAMMATNLAWWEWDYKTGNVHFSNSKLEMLGYEANTNIMNINEWIKKIHPDDYDSSVNAMRDHLSGRKEIYEIVYRMQTKNGRWKWFLNRGKILEKNNNGTPLKLLGTVQDVTDRIVTEQEKERLFNYSHDMFCVINFDNEIISVNPAWTRTLGWKRVKLENEIISQFVFEDDRDFFDKQILSIKKTRKPLVGINIRMLRKNGSSQWISCNAITLPEEEKIFIVGRDIAELKEKEEKIQEYQVNLEEKVKERTKELGNAIAAKNKFFSIISHDLRGPIAGLYSMLKLLVEEKLDESYKEKALKELLNSTRATYDLLENLLLWARSQNDNVEYNPQIIRIKELIKKVEYLYRNNFEQKNIRFHLEIEEDCCLWVDENMFMTVIRNLISNALKFTPSGGMISLKGSKEKDYAFIIIEDNGIGIPKEKISKLFQIDKTYTSLGTADEKGSGLGLILVKEFVERNEGSIHIESKEDKGTLVKLKFPI